LVSGTGTILESFYEHGLNVSVVASDRECRGLDVARTNGSDVVLVERKAYGGFAKDFDREAYTLALTKELVSRGVTLVAMAGFGTILSATFHDAFPGRVLNTHPSLLPDFKGWHAVRLALEAGVRETGCTVHIATTELDDGPILAQRSVPVLSGDNEETLHERIKNVERTLYPEVLVRVIEALEHGDEPSSLAQ